MANNFNLIHKASSLFWNNNDNPLSDVQAQHTMQDIPKNSNPSPDTPPGIPLSTSPPKDIPRNILAFRTITKLISHIQQEKAFQVSWNNSSADKEELALSTAFATIAVIDHEIIAVVTRHTCKEIKVLLTSQTPNKAPSIDRSSWLKRGFDFIVAKNPRQKDPPTIFPTDEPTISCVDDAGILPGTDLDNDEMLKTWVDECW